MKIKQLFQLATLCAVAVLGSACSTTLEHGALNGTPSGAKGRLGVASHAENMPSPIGYGTFTVFAIPVAPVTVTGQPNVELMNQVKAAVEHSGYSVKLVENGEAPGMPVLSCSVKKFAFKNYTYFFPIVFNWGGIELDVTVKSPGGAILWSKSYTASGSGAYSFNSTVNGTLTKVLNQMIADLSTANFKTVAVR